MQAEVEETLKRIEAHKGVIGTIVVNAEGKPKKKHKYPTVFSDTTCLQYSLTVKGAV